MRGRRRSEFIGWCRTTIAVGRLVIGASQWHRVFSLSLPFRSSSDASVFFASSSLISGPSFFHPTPGGFHKSGRESNKIKKGKKERKRNAPMTKGSTTIVYSVWGLYGFPLFLFASLFLACLVMSVSYLRRKESEIYFLFSFSFFPFLFLYFPFDLNNPGTLGLYIFNYRELIHSLECVQLPPKKGSVFLFWFCFPDDR